MNDICEQDNIGQTVESDEAVDQSLSQYDINAFPNDFNVGTLCDMFDRGTVDIPNFQRNYVWDQKRASKFIESLLIGIPVPQLFLFEKAKNKYVLIDGQQRYLSMYFFVKGRFPKADTRSQLRTMLKSRKGIPSEVLQNNDLFIDFALKLPSDIEGQVSKFNKYTYDELEPDEKESFGLKTVRSIFIKQNSQDDDDSAMFEIFNRLNTGGMNLKPQEIRASLYASNFYDKLMELNEDANWRYLFNDGVPHVNMADIEVILRGFAFLDGLENYNSNLKKFLNAFSKNSMDFPDEKINRMAKIFTDFVKYVRDVNENAFYKGEKFFPALYETIFYALCKGVYDETGKMRETTKEKINELANNEEFAKTLTFASAGTSNVRIRFDIATRIL